MHFSTKALCLALPSTSNYQSQALLSESPFKDLQDRKEISQDPHMPVEGTMDLSHPCERLCQSRMPRAIERILRAGRSRSRSRPIDRLRLSKAFLNCCSRPLPSTRPWPNKHGALSRGTRPPSDPRKTSSQASAFFVCPMLGFQVLAHLMGECPTFKMRSHQVNTTHFVLLSRSSLQVLAWSSSRQHKAFRSPFQVAVLFQRPPPTFGSTGPVQTIQMHYGSSLRGCVSF